MNDYKDFFERYGDYGVHLGFYDIDETITVENLYQQFKSRMLAELKEDANRLERIRMDARMKMPRRQGEKG
jgi:hypothetical protein